jgi:tRNA (cytidine/uridine-2'-O-)-methyltransferase
MVEIVLVEPEIPWNTGNVGRTCLAAGAPLHLVGRLGFSLSERRLKRAGLDYWPRVDLSRHESWAAFRAARPRAALRAFAPQGRRSLWEAPLEDGACLVFGSESRGLPPEALADCGEHVYRIPMRPGARSLNLSTSVAVALYEAARRLKKDEVGQSLFDPAIGP